MKTLSGSCRRACCVIWVTPCWRLQDGAEGWRVANEHVGHIDLVMTDVIMPKMSGRELADQHAHLPDPQTRFLFCTGYTDNAIVHHGVLESGIFFMHKPYTPTTLAVKVRETLDAPG